MYNFLMITLSHFDNYIREVFIGFSSIDIIFLSNIVGERPVAAKQELALPRALYEVPRALPIIDSQPAQTPAINEIMKR